MNGFESLHSLPHRTIRRSVRKEPLLKFIEWGGRLVFDAANPHVFAEYCDRVAAAVAAAAATQNSSAADTAGVTEAFSPDGGMEGSQGTEDEDTIYNQFPVDKLKELEGDLADEA